MKVRIYQDPITRTQIEGVAQVVKKCYVDDNLVRAKVRFPGEQKVVERWIHDDDWSEAEHGRMERI
jgi:hypothetical protein